LPKKKSGPSSHNSGTAPRLIVTRQKRLEALELRKSGMTYRQIGKVMKCSAPTAHQWVGQAFAELITSVQDAAEDVRRMELDRLDTMQRALWPECEAGD
jgi:predicted NACHT family NTPase